MKICLIEPPYNVFIEELDPPFPLMYLASMAEQCGWEAEILDMRTSEDAIPEAEVHGVTSTSPQWSSAVRVSEIIAEKYPDSLRIVGGNHISAVYHDRQFAIAEKLSTLAETKFNLAVVGEGENALASTLPNYKDYRHGCNLCYGKPIESLDAIPFPAHRLVDWKRYKRGIFWGKERLSDAVSIITSRGCPHNCVFCGSHVVFGRRTRFRSIANVIAEMRLVMKILGYRGFNFHDDTFCLNRKRVLNLCSEFVKLDIVWRCLSRADTIDSEVLTAMQASGCKEIILGVESGSQKILDTLNKNTTVSENLRAMKMIKESGIQLKVGIIVGSPGETWETVKETMMLLKACPPNYWNVSCFTPFPGSFAWEHPEELGIKILTRDLREYAMVGKEFKGNVVVETEGMKKEDIEQARDRLIDLLLDISGENYR